MTGDVLAELVKTLAGATQPITITACAVVLLVVFTACGLTLISAGHGVGFR